MTNLNAFPLILAVVAGALAAGFFVAGARALRARRPAASAVRALTGALLLVCGVLLAVIVVATQGYRALTREELAATVTVEPTGPRRFVARVELPDGRRDTFDVAGDQIYVDAHILKWKPVANLLGLHTAYQLDRIGGRYDDIASELDREKTVYSLKSDRPLDMFELRRSVELVRPLFRPLLDAEYGSGTFRGVTATATYDVYVSTTGLLIRPRRP
ncbi:MAG: hypothetical protein PVF05_02800 [Gemmatimonadales bacterium]